MSIAINREMRTLFSDRDLARKPVALVAHDAGGAEIVSSFARREGLRGVASAVGPAQGIIAKKLPDWADTGLPEAIALSDWLLCGTSWQSNHELVASRLARSAGKPVVAFLDHWVAYRERFLLDGVPVLPDEIWVGDQYAEELARREFSGTRVRDVGNSYLDEIREELAALSAEAIEGTECPSILYVCEPIAEQALRQHADARYWGYTEEEALRYFFKRRESLGLERHRIILRPHPAETPGKYDWVRRQFGATVEIGGQRSLLSEIVPSQTVVGCESMAMVIALLAGKRVVSSIPPGGAACALPHRDIEILRNIPSPCLPLS